MAKVAVPGSLSSNSLSFERDASKLKPDTTMKRKTPLELRGEQLNRRSCTEHVDESAVPLFGHERNSNKTVGGFRKTDSAKIPRYIDTRVNEVFPVRKSSDRFRVLYGKEKAKDKFSSDKTTSLEKPVITSNLASTSQPQLPCSSSFEASGVSAKDSRTQAHQTTEMYRQNTFRTVAELSSGNERLSGLGTVDMDIALKGLLSREPSAVSHPTGESNEKFGDIPSIHSGTFVSEFHIPGQKTPLDFTLKTSMRLVSSSSVNWCHRLAVSGTPSTMVQFISQVHGSRDQNVSHLLGRTSTCEVMYAKSLCSWVYPQSSLPPSVISALTLATAQGDTDFLLKRQLAWEVSFQNLYYMLRKNICDIFYVCTSQFVVMFIGGKCLGKKMRLCNAYVSQSTRGLRSLLREHDVCFTMPLRHSEMEQVDAEDLVELSEIEKHSQGQIGRLVSMPGVDNCPQSLLAFRGNENVQGLYDFLLNYRSIVSSLTGIDVPLLYGPVPFQNASLCAPEVKCREMKRADTVVFPVRASHTDDGESNQGSSVGISYSIEIKDTFLPPWIISGVCAAMGSEGRSFEASFTTEPLSIGLNVALESVTCKSDPQTEGEGLLECTNAFGVPEAVVNPCLHSASLRGLKYSDGSYTASLLPI
ncbi:protein downstream neighbor of Son-like isoform X1 [Telopea speciosissima]|uniref:protein downstream neighbor of Son-like isoform X1 n=1 Tax=Telopea speciosissima TaxID=54955 RepID=UPI001CC63A5F|nr:protein downstream neighbor of Son-like isoform X1 [Telopea speciosissima]